jgi:probable addiction module antidote protein
MKHGRSHKVFIVEQLKKDPKFRMSYLNEALSDPEEDPRVILEMLRHVAEAEGGLGKLAKATQLNRQSLYKTLSGKGSPEYATVSRILRGLGYCFQVIENKRPSVRQHA